jgi:hypothetical protein
MGRQTVAATPRSRSQRRAAATSTKKATSPNRAVLEQLRQIVGEVRNPVAYRRLDVKADGEAHLKEYGVAPLRWIVILVLCFVAVMRFHDSALLVDALTKFLHFP